MNETLYRAYLCSRVANKDCATCSHFVPDGFRDPDVPDLTGFIANTRCPDCGRTCSRVFISTLKKPPEEVPNDYPFIFPRELFMFTHPHVKTAGVQEIYEWLKRYTPRNPKKGFDFTTWQHELSIYMSAYNSGNPRKAEEPNLFTQRSTIPANRGKEIKRKVKFS